MGFDTKRAAERRSKARCAGGPTEGQTEGGAAWIHSRFSSSVLMKQRSLEATPLPSCAEAGDGGGVAEEDDISMEVLNPTFSVLKVGILLVPPITGQNQISTNVSLSLV